MPGPHRDIGFRAALPARAKEEAEAFLTGAKNCRYFSPAVPYRRIADTRSGRSMERFLF